MKDKSCLSKGFFSDIQTDTMVDDDALLEQLESVKAEHKALDEQIEQLSRIQPVDFLTITKLKKDKLRLKDAIQRLESMLIPDIIA